MLVGPASPSREPVITMAPAGNATPHVAQPTGPASGCQQSPGAASELSLAPHRGHHAARGTGACDSPASGPDRSVRSSRRTSSIGSTPLGCGIHSVRTNHGRSPKSDGRRCSKAPRTDVARRRDACRRRSLVETSETPMRSSRTGAKIGIRGRSNWIAAISCAGITRGAAVLDGAPIQSDAAPDATMSRSGAGAGDAAPRECAGA